MKISNISGILPGAIILWIIGFAPPDSIAQPQLNLKRLDYNYPYVELRFTVSCDGQNVYFLDKNNFRIQENGFKISDFTLDCYDTEHQFVSTVIALDAGASMKEDNGYGNIMAKMVATVFTDMMDSLKDEAAIMWFNKQSVVVLPKTVDRQKITAAIDSLPADGESAVWDGIYDAIIETINTGSNPSRSVIAISTGKSSVGKHTPAEVILLANVNGVRVYTIGVGKSPECDTLKLIANSTNGMFYDNPSPINIWSMYQDITSDIILPWQECVITYLSQGMDGSLRVVDLSLGYFCGGNDTKTKTYWAARDTSTFLTLTIRIGKKTDFGNREVSLPLTLETDVSDILAPITFNLLYDENCVQFKNISTPAGSFWENVPITLTKIPGGITVKTQKETMVSGPGTFAEFVFHSSDPIGDTVCCPIKLMGWNFESGDFKPVLKGGEICIIPRSPPRVLGSCQAPKELKWNAQTNDYDPNPFTVALTLYNSGETEANNVRYKIAYDPNDLAAVSPIADIQYDAREILKPEAFTEGKWDLLAKSRATGDSVLIRIAAAFDNHDSVRCSMKVWIPPASATTSTDIGDRILTYTLYQNHPNPFNPTTEIAYEIPFADHVRLAVYDLFGRELKLLVNEWQAAGGYTIPFNSDFLPSGIYVYKLETTRFSQMRKMLLMK